MLVAFRKRLILFEKKRGKGIELSYSEFSYRMAMWQFAIYCKKNQNASYDVLENLLEGFDILKVETSICQLEKIYGISFSYEAHQQLLFLLSFTISRIRKKFFVEITSINKCKTDSEYEEGVTTWLQKELELGYEIHIPNEEKQFIKFLIQVSDIQSFSNEKKQEEFEQKNIELCCITIKLANLLGEIMNTNLMTDVIFLECFMLQLRSTIQRLRYHMKWKHPLLKQVKQKYPNIFTAVYAAGVFFDKELGMELNEHEMCGIALHLGGALERNTSILTVCVVCNYGIGVSQLLRERIERGISELRVHGVFSIRDIRKIRASSCDFIISTLPLDEFDLAQDVVVVEHLLPAYDLIQIGNKMKQIRKRKLKTRPFVGTLPLQKTLFNKDFVWLEDVSLNKEEIIHKMCKALFQSGHVTGEFEESVFEHEERAPTCLGSGVALPHGYAKHVIRPIVAVASLKRPIMWEKEEPVTLIFLLAFNLDEASGLKDETIKFYRVFLDILDSEEEMSMVKKIVVESELAEYMNQKIRGDKHI